MRKERLELFSDGVFAIILTLLVLDLKVPEGRGVEGLRAAMPGLLVHAGAFFVIGMAWITHHQFLEHVETIGRSMLGWNLLVLFWITLIPFGARIAAEHPGDGLGAAIIAGSLTLAQASIIGMVLFGQFQSVAHDSRLARHRQRRVAVFLIYVVVGIAVTAGCFVSPWFGYVFMTIGATALLTPSVSELHARVTTSNPAGG